MQLKLNEKTYHEVPAEGKMNEVVGFDVNLETMQGPLESGWEEIAKEFAAKLKGLVP